MDTIPADMTTTTATTTSDGSVRGDLETADDVDWYRASLTKEHCYRIRRSGKGHETGLTLQNPLLTGVYRSDGTRIERTSDNYSGPSGEAQVLLKLHASGTFYIGVQQSLRGGNRKIVDGGSYRLSLTYLGTESAKCEDAKAMVKELPTVSIEDTSRLEGGSFWSR